MWLHAWEGKAHPTCCTRLGCRSDNQDSHAHHHHHHHHAHHHHNSGVEETLDMVALYGTDVRLTQDQIQEAYVEILACAAKEGCHAAPAPPAGHDHHDHHDHHDGDDEDASMDAFQLPPAEPTVRAYMRNLLQQLRATKEVGGGGGRGAHNAQHTAHNTQRTAHSLCWPFRCWHPSGAPPPPIASMVPACMVPACTVSGPGRLQLQTRAGT